jgi:hypothetical protein
MQNSNAIILILACALAGFEPGPSFQLLSAQGSDTASRFVVSFFIGLKRLKYFLEKWHQT